MSRRFRNPNVVGWTLMAGAIGLAAALVFWLERGLTYGWDEFAWLELSGLAGDLTLFFHPYGGHLIAFPYFIWRGMLELFGASFTAFAIVQVFGLSLLGLLLYVYAKRRVGPILALAPAIAMLFLGSAWAVVLEPMMGIQFLAALVPGLAALLMLERGDRVGDAAACGLLCLSLTGFSESVPFLLGAIVAVALGPDWKRRLWVVAVPVVAYGAWRLWAAQFESTGILVSNVPLLPAYFSDALAVFGSAVFGLAPHLGSGPWTALRLQQFSATHLAQGVVLAVVELLAIGTAFWLFRRRGPVPRTFWPPLAILLGLWVELGIILIPGRTAGESRYMYAGVLVLLLVIVEMLRGIRTTRLTVAIAIALTAAAVLGNLPRFHEGRQLLDTVQMEARADMAVIQLAGRNGNQRFTPDLSAPHLASNAIQLNTGPWLEVVARYGSSADSIAELRRQNEAVREAADGIAAKTLELRLTGAEAPAAACRWVRSRGGQTELVLPKGGVILRSVGGSEVRLRRWAGDFATGLGEVQGGRWTALSIPGDPSDVPWRLRFERGGAVEVCPPAAAG